MGRPVTINGRELNINDASFIEANAEYSVTVDDDGTVMVERTDLKAENEKLRELVADMWHDGMCECDEYGICAKCEYHYHERMRELGIEVDG